MRTKFCAVLAAVFLGGLSLGWATDTADQTQNQQALDKARTDYRTYLTQLKALNKRYKEVTGQIAQVVKEEGLPTWDNNTDSLGFTGSLQDQAVVEDARIQETDKEMTVGIDLPGLKKNTIKVRIEDVRILKISATRTIGQEVRSIERTVKLPAPAQEKGTEAKYEDGVLTVKIPKAAKKEITVPVS